WLTAGWTIFFFFALQFGCGWLLDHFGLAIRFPDAANVLGHLPEPAANSDIVFLGSSRFKGGIVPAQIAGGMNGRPRVLNAAVSAGDPIAMEFMFSRLTERGVRPDTLLIEVSPEILNHRTYWLRYHLERQLTWADLPSYLADLKAMGQLGNTVKSRLLPLRFFRAPIADALGMSPGPPSPGKPTPPANEGNVVAERVGPDGLTAGQRELFRAGIEHATSMLENYEIGGQPPAALERILAHCQEHGIRVILVGVPLTTYFRSAVTPAIDGEYRAFLEEMCRRYDCRFVDYGGRVPDRFFLDVHHLSPEGATFFSRLLAREVLHSEPDALARAVPR
ncbi:hypothetical protein AYO40_05380, partial [Planctomycetaceae bacterium SCGC AG-212-D15]